MQYLDCSRCRARFHTGAIYERLVVCPRCGAPLDLPQPTVGERLRALIRHREAGEEPDWELITGSQYVTRSYVMRAEPEDPPSSARQPTEGGAPPDAVSR